MNSGTKPTIAPASFERLALILTTVACVTGLCGCGDGSNNSHAARVANTSGDSMSSSSSSTPDSSPIATNCDE
jgi:hypothetical protein